MPNFSKASLAQLNTCHPDLQKICNEAIKIMDFSVLEGHRDEKAQNLAYKQKRSKVKWPEGKHNAMPSLAVDIAPYPINWNDTKRFYALAGVMFAIAHQHGIKLRWGGTWGDLDTINKSGFLDLPHFELVV